MSLAAASGYDRLAIAPDVRTSGPFGDLSTSIASASTNGASPEILFLDATEEALVRRFSETRRKHPIARERLTEAIASERRALAPVRDRAERVWDTSAMSAIQLRRRIAETYAQQAGEPLLHVTLVCSVTNMAYRSTQIWFSTCASYRIHITSTSCAISRARQTGRRLSQRCPRRGPFCSTPKVCLIS